MAHWFIQVDINTPSSIIGQGGTYENKREVTAYSQLQKCTF